ncbi:MAG: DinB family protein [Aliihoeflea sp.]
MKQHFSMFAAYNAWANRLIFDAAANASEDALWTDLGLAFTSLGGTLNHVLVADRIWMKRFTGEGAAAKRLDTILFREIGPLWDAREAEDERILRYVADLTDDDLAGRFSYITATDMRTISQRLAPALAHFFNHQTHHRGQAHAALTRLTGKAPSLDLIYFQRSDGGRNFA